MNAQYALKTIEYENLCFDCRLAEVGKLAIPKVHEKYETGQFFLHRVFGYRGVILFPWRAKIYDRNTYVSNGESSSLNITETDSTLTSDENVASTGVKQNIQSTRKNEATDTDSIRNDGKKEVTVDVQTYYQVLIDSRDCPHVVSLTIFYSNNARKTKLN